MSQIVLPEHDKRTAIIGSTGSGKTQAAAWLLSTRDLDKRPWIIFDYKGDALIAEMDAKQITVTGPVPTKPGLYIVRPLPSQEEEVTEFLWKIWKQENVGVYVDEGYMLGMRNPALNAVLTQGRSKNIEMIILSQRPKWMSKFVFTEANFFMVFHLTSIEDRKYVSTFIDGEKINRLPKYYSTWYDVDRQQGAVFSPVPNRDAILGAIDSKLRRRPKRI